MNRRVKYEYVAENSVGFENIDIDESIKYLKALKKKGVSVLVFDNDDDTLRMSSYRIIVEFQDKKLKYEN